MNRAAENLNAGRRFEESSTEGQAGSLLERLNLHIARVSRVSTHVTSETAFFLGIPISSELAHMESETAAGIFPKPNIDLWLALTQFLGHRLSAYFLIIFWPTSRVQARTKPASLRAEL